MRAKAKAKGDDGSDGENGGDQLYGLFETLPSFQQNSVSKPTAAEKNTSRAAHTTASPLPRTKLPPTIAIERDHHLPTQLARPGSSRHLLPLPTGDCQQSQSSLTYDRQVLYSSFPGPYPSQPPIQEFPETNNILPPNAKYCQRPRRSFSNLYMPPPPHLLAPGPSFRHNTLSPRIPHLHASHLLFPGPSVPSTHPRATASA
jgi:hypothetical protein